MLKSRPVQGMLERNGVGCLLLPSGQTAWYPRLSKPTLVSVQPAIWTRSASDAGKHQLSSPSAGSVPRCSTLAAGQVVTLPLESIPNAVAGIWPGPVQVSKCPISLVKDTLVVWAAQIVRVSGVDVLYIGWKL